MSADPPGRPTISNAHAQEADYVADILGATSDGLCSELAADRLRAFGPNRPRIVQKPSIVRRFLSHFNNILIYVLLVAAAITSVLGHLIDTIVILAVVIVNAVIGLAQEGRAEQAMTKIQQMLAPHAAVIRDGKRLDISSEELVLGDLVLLEAGDRVPADLRLVEAYGLQAQEAVLTGESLPVEKGPAPVAMDASLGDRSSLAFSGTLVTAGQGRGIVIATAEETEIGRISGMLADVRTLTTPLVEQMNGFARWLTLLILLIAATLLAFGYYVANLEFSEVFMAIVGLSVSAIPEGLPAVLTITLAIGVQAMARRNAIVRRLPAIETLGSVSIICTDKTGTLTRNEMMAASVALADQTFSIAGEGYGPEGEISNEHASDDPAYSEALSELALVAALCNDAELNETGGSWTVSGEALTIIITILLGLTLPITPIQILWINLVTATTLGIALAFEPTEEDTMLRPPRPRAEPILNGTLAWQIIFASLLISAGVFGVFAYAIEQQYELELARTLALNMLAIMEIFYLFYVRNIYGSSLTWTAVRGTKAVWLTVIAVFAAQLGITYAPPLQVVFATRPVPFADGVLLFAIGTVFFAALELEKRLRLNLRAMGQTAHRQEFGGSNTQ